MKEIDATSDFMTHGIPVETLQKIISHSSGFIGEIYRLRGVSKYFKWVVEGFIVHVLRGMEKCDLRNDLQAQWIVSKPQLALRARYALNALPNDTDSLSRAQSLVRKAVAARRFTMGRGRVNLIQLAIDQGPEALKMVLSMGADPNGTVEGLSALHYAIKRGSKEAIKQLLTYGVSLEGGSAQEPPLHMAVRLGKLDIVKFLLKKGAEPDQPYLLRGESNNNSEEFSTPLRIAAAENYPEMVRVLLESGASVNDSIPGISALTYAVAIGDPEMVSLLDSSAASELKEATTALLINTAVTSRNRELLGQVLDRGGNLNSRLSNGETGMHTAVSCGDIDMVHLLHVRGLDVNVADHQGVTPLHIAAKQKDLLCLTKLITAGANLEARDSKGRTPLVYAIRKQRKASVRKLLEAGAKADVSYGNGLQKRQAIHSAARRGSRTIVELLIRYHANPTVLNGRGQTPRSIARRNGHTSLYSLLPKLQNQSRRQRKNRSHG